MTRLAVLTMAGLVGSVILGCAPQKTLDTVPVSGLVTLDGTPVQGANVVFAPTSGTGMAASGITGADGRYQLTTQDPSDGALPGSYVVMISKSEVEKTAVDEAVKPGMSAEDANKAAMEAFVAGGEKAPEVKDLLPAKYKNAAESGLKAEVAKGAAAEFNFELTSS